jgi:hypothetical protein
VGERGLRAGDQAARLGGMRLVALRAPQALVSIEVRPSEAAGGTRRAAWRQGDGHREAGSRGGQWGSGQSLRGAAGTEGDDGGLFPGYLGEEEGGGGAAAVAGMSRHASKDEGGAGLGKRPALSLRVG